MRTHSTPQNTDFSRDIIGRYMCNGFDEALSSTNTFLRPDARPFDIIVLGGGTIGGAIAQHLFHRDATHKHRILVLEAGPYLLPEHLQNMPMTGLQIYGPPATSIKQLREEGNYGLDKPRDEVWGLPWHGSVPFPGIAYCIGGRSLMWGGWSPQLTKEEMPVGKKAPNPWPKEVVNDLINRYYREASEQLGVTETNDFIHGELHEVLRQRLYDGVQKGKISNAIPLKDLPLHLDDVPKNKQNLFKLEAPLAVQSRNRSGFFPMNKFSSVPLLMKASRDAWGECNFDDVKKRLMVVPNCHIKRLKTVEENDSLRVTGVETNLGFIPFPEHGKVINALGTVESTRLAQLSFPGIPQYDLIGKNLIGDMISLFFIRIPRSSLPVDTKINDLQTSALIVAGKKDHEKGGSGFFHLQITGTGLGPMDYNAEAELYQKIPDIDSMQAFRYASDTHVVLGILGVAKMEPQNPQSHVSLDPEKDEFGMQRAFVGIEPTPNDLATWDAMDAASDEAAKVFAGGKPFEVLNYEMGMVPVTPDQDLSQVVPGYMRRFGLGDSHHEAGTLWMGDDSATSVTDKFGRFHHVSNAYVASPAQFPSNAAPVLTGIALARRLADHLIPDPTPYQPEKGFVPLFDGINTYTWQMLGEGNFTVVDGTLESVPGKDLGLFWNVMPTPKDFVLRLEWLRWREQDNSGVFLRFPNPYSKGYMNPAYVAVDFGFEVQIDERGMPDGEPWHKTGAIYGQAEQKFNQIAANPPGQWNTFEIQAKGHNYKVLLNGKQVSTFKNPNPDIGVASTPESPSFIGLQSYPGSRVAFRNIRIKEV